MSVLNFEEFCDYIVNHVLDYLEDYEEAQVCKNRVIKNNGVYLTAVEILENGRNCSPNIYCEPFYDKYRSGVSLEEILIEIAAFYESHKDGFDISVDHYHEFEWIKERIVFRLVNKTWNEELLAHAPCIEWNDLVITFRWVAGLDEIGVASALVTNRELELWQTSKEELYNFALYNTERIFPVYIDHIENVVFSNECEKNKQLRKEFELIRQSPNYVPMYILTNEQRINGATVILYENTIKNLSEQEQSNLFLLPSSINEMIVIPDNGTFSYEYLRWMVLEANETVVDHLDRLSDNVYYYDMELEQVKTL